MLKESTVWARKEPLSNQSPSELTAGPHPRRGWYRGPSGWWGSPMWSPIIPVMGAMKPGVSNGVWATTCWWFCYWKTGFTSWWVSASRQHQAKDREKEGSATITTRHETTDWFKIGKGVRQSCTLSPCLFNFYAEDIMWNVGLDDSQAEIKIGRRSINSLTYADYTSLMAESEEETKEPLDEGERGEWKSWFKTQHSENEDHGIQSH